MIPRGIAGDVMRRRNVRVILAGALLLVLGAGFFIVMLGMAPRSNDPKALMQTVGQVTGVVGGIGAAMIVAGLIGTKKKA